MNQITITGNLGSDPELKMAADTTLAEFSFAHTPYSKTKGEGEPIWFRVTFWNSKADLVMDSLRKGDRIMLTGALGENKWEKDGVKRSSLEIKGVEFAIIPRSPKNAAPVVHSVHETEVAPW
jgi:single-strand DNA-binding protein